MRSSYKPSIIIDKFTGEEREFCDDKEMIIIGNMEGFIIGIHTMMPSGRYKGGIFTREIRRPFECIKARVCGVLEKASTHKFNMGYVISKDVFPDVERELKKYKNDWHKELEKIDPCHRELFDFWWNYREIKMSLSLGAVL